jgi:isopenicillin-N epimerase
MTDTDIAGPGASGPRQHTVGQREQWPLDPGVVHLNHGSFGAVPRPVLEVQQQWRDRMESNPMRFIRTERWGLIEQARRDVAAFLNAPLDGLTLVSNVTQAASTVLSWFPFEAGDDVLVSDHAYGAVRFALDRAASAAGARVVEVAIPLTADADEISALVLGAVTPRTRLAVLDQITSATARRFPVERLVPELRARDVPVFVDAAHAPGMLPVDVAALDPDFWTGNFHKWVCAPRASAVLYAGARWRSSLTPQTVSWRIGEGYPYSFLDAGVTDFSPWLTMPAAADFLGGFGWDRVRAHNVALVDYGQRTLADALGVEPASMPADDGLSMRLVPLPGTALTSQAEVDLLRDRVADEASIETAMTFWNGRALLRLSAQLYNTPSDYRRLAEVLPAMLAC